MNTYKKENEINEAECLLKIEQSRLSDDGERDEEDEESDYQCDEMIYN